LQLSLPLLLRLSLPLLLSVLRRHSERSEEPLYFAFVFAVAGTQSSRQSYRR
jgi:hypothetical protein